MNPMDGFNTGLITLREISKVLRDAEALAKKLDLKFTWKLRFGKPLGEIMEGDKTIWSTEFTSRQFHFAYASMLIAIHSKLLDVEKTRNLEKSKQDEQARQTAIAQGRYEYVMKNYYGDIKPESSTFQDGDFLDPE